jgi:hypothetical protein
VKTWANRQTNKNESGTAEVKLLPSILFINIQQSFVALFRGNSLRRGWLHSIGRLTLPLTILVSLCLNLTEPCRQTYNPPEARWILAFWQDMKAIDTGPG